MSIISDTAAILSVTQSEDLIRIFCSKCVKLCTPLCRVETVHCVRVVLIVV